MTPAVTVPVFYTCHGCQIVEREVQVAARKPLQDVVVWVNAVRHAVSADHRVTSPSCEPVEFDLKIPLASKNSRIGEATRH